MLGENHLAQQPHVDRIEPAERLVENQQIRLVQNGRDELYFLQHPFRQLFTFPVLDAAEAEPLEPGCNLRRRKMILIFETRHVYEKRAHFHLPIDATLFGQIANPIFGFDRRWPAQYCQLASIRKQDRHDHPERRRLSGSVGPDESVQRAFGYLEIEVIDCHGGAEGFRDAAQRNGEVHAAYQSSARIAQRS